MCRTPCNRRSSDDCIVSSRGAEALSVERAFSAIKRADVVILVLDAAQGVTEQDFKLAEFTSQQVVCFCKARAGIRQLYWMAADAFLAALLLSSAFVAVLVL